MEDEDDVHEPDLVVDSWDKRLDEGFSVFLKDMFKENVSAREEHREQAEQIQDAEHAEDGEHVVEQSIQLGDVMKILKKW